ncbi:glycoside hydrolase family 15 protein [Kitasatospora sp. NPDC087315]|uniref:glycoside hydrolase family 15 protein n=1 Tax=Kitasatospora sp. NPDC087315 TaxID=3364069 RepID=UPI003816360D
MPRTAPPARIEDHALIGNTASAALIRTDGTITWACLPRFDAPAVFAGLLGTAGHGFWQVAPAVYDGTTPPPATRRRYRGNSLILEQEWDTPTGSVRVTDFMPAPDATDRAPAQIIRVVEGLTGQVRVASDFRPRPGYGSTTPRIRRTGQHDRARLSATAGPDAYCLGGLRHSPGRQGTSRADFAVTAGQNVVLSLTWHPSRMPAPQLPDGLAALADTQAYWDTWSSRSTYQGPDRSAVLRAAITLKGLCHMDGGIVAAPTTSLPEDIGGERNWDYRYTWLRDAALTVATLVKLGFPDEARAWRDWLTSTIDPADLRIMYGLGGELDLAERVLEHLPGYEGSRPVRVGNGAAGQLQLDVYGEVAHALLAAEDAGLTPDRDCDERLLAMAGQLEQQWREPDEGIWEVRGPRRHFTHSRVMVWVFFDRLITMLDRRPSTTRKTLSRLRELRETIHQDVCEKGYDPERGTFTQYYGGRELDAALLLIPRVGFLPADDKRVIGTIEAVQRELSTVDGFVLRYPTHDENGANVDGLTGHEGAFLACSFWLADALAMIGRAPEARELFDKLLALRNDVGLLAEEWDPREKRQVGNFPQAFSMWALADTAVDLAAHGTVSTPLPRQRTAADGTHTGLGARAGALGA